MKKIVFVILISFPFLFFNNPCEAGKKCATHRNKYGIQKVGKRINNEELRGKKKQKTKNSQKKYLNSYQFDKIGD